MNTQKELLECAVKELLLAEQLCTLHGNNGNTSYATSSEYKMMDPKDGVRTKLFYLAVKKNGEDFAIEGDVVKDGVKINIDITIYDISDGRRSGNKTETRLAAYDGLVWLQIKDSLKNQSTICSLTNTSEMNVAKLNINKDLIYEHLGIVGVGIEGCLAKENIFKFKGEFAKEIDSKKYIKVPIKLAKVTAAAFLAGCVAYGGYAGYKEIKKSKLIVPEPLQLQIDTP